MKSQLLKAAPAFLLMLLLAWPAYSSPSPFTGKTITRIDIKDDRGRPWPKPGRLLPLIVAGPGSALSGEAVRETLSLLYLKGLYKDIQVDAFPDNGGVRLEYTLFPITVVAKIEIHGNDALSKDEIREATFGIEGKEALDRKLAALSSDILSLYQAEGYYEAAVAFRTEPHKDPYQVVLHVDIRESKPTEIAEVAFTGNHAFTDKKLRSMMKNKTGSTLQRDRLLDADMEAILKKYAKEGYPAVQAGPVDIRFADHQAFVHILLKEGPKVTVRFTGNETISSARLKQELLIWSEREVSDSIIDSSVEKIKTLYRGKGYTEASVAVKKTEEPGVLNLDFIVREGTRVSVRTIAITGNSVFSEKELKQMMALREPGWFTSPPFQEELLDKDIDYLHDRYIDAGYLSASVTSRVDLIDDKKAATVKIGIAEGPQTKTGAISFEGNTAFSSAELLALVNLKEGAPFNERLMEEDKYRILMAYSNKAYLYAQVDVDKSSRNGAVDVRYRITEDMPVSIGRIILRGNEGTKDNVIMRELLVKPGDRYDYGAILSSQQRIYHLGYIRVARFDPVHPGEKEYVKDMLFTVEERPAGAFEVGIGYGDLDRFRGSVEVSHRNLWGTARYSSLRYEQSDILKRAIFNFQEPWFLNRKLDAKFSLLWSDSERLNSDTRETYYNTRKTAASFGIEKSYEKLKPSLTYQFENVVNYNVLQATQLTPEDSGRVLVSSLSPALVLDLRDDLFNPRKGALYGIVLKESLRELWSEVDFSKLMAQASWFIPLGGDVVAALSARGGTAWPFRGTPEIPLHERFYVGGSTTVRGFNQDTIGPSSLDAGGNPIPTGGRSMAVFNIEFRLNPGEGLGFVLFTDAGNVWPGQQLFLEDLRSSYGGGIRYGTPIGPLRIDYGQKIDRLPGESPGEIHFNIGNTF